MIPTPFSVVVSITDGTAVVAMAGELDLATATRVRAVVAATTQIPGVGRIEVDGQALDFVDSAGLSALLHSRADAHDAGLLWFVGAMSPALKRMLELTGVGATLADAGMN
jgi:anti-anti-sigma factor